MKNKKEINCTMPLPKSKSEQCPFKLSCGICRLTNQDCPKSPFFDESNITCSSLKD